jgi:hypothetical protein
MPGATAALQNPSFLMALIKPSTSWWTASELRYRETEIERADLETVISDLLTGQFNAPVRIVAFNTLKHWAQDVSQEVAEGIQTRCDIEGEPVPEHVRDFVESHRGTARQLALRFGS